MDIKGFVFWRTSELPTGEIIARPGLRGLGNALYPQLEKGCLSGCSFRRVKLPFSRVLIMLK
jgi:hypothetical protein